jgi:hypothetical protein
MIKKLPLLFAEWMRLGQEMRSRAPKAVQKPVAINAWAECELRSLLKNDPNVTGDCLRAFLRGFYGEAQ